MSIYKLNNATWGTHNIIKGMLGENKTVLDVGCNKGYLSEVAPNNIYYGIDNNEVDLKIAGEKYKKVYKIDLNNYYNFSENTIFDVIIFADILEHLLNPERVLEFFVSNYLKKSGTVIISLPNVANFYIRINLFLGKFNYTESGILDNTHIHLYTLSTSRNLISNAGLEIKKTMFSSNNFGLFISIFPYLGPLFGFNLIFKCKKY